MSLGRDGFLSFTTNHAGSRVPNSRKTDLTNRFTGTKLRTVYHCRCRYGYSTTISLTRMTGFGSSSTNCMSTGTCRDSRAPRSCITAVPVPVDYIRFNFHCTWESPPAYKHPPRQYRYQHTATDTGTLCWESPPAYCTSTPRGSITATGTVLYPPHSAIQWPSSATGSSAPPTQGPLARCVAASWPACIDACIFFLPTGRCASGPRPARCGQSLPVPCSHRHCGR